MKRLSLFDENIFEMPEDRIVQVYTLEEISNWLDKGPVNAESVWFVLEETKHWENPEMLLPMERLFTEKELEYSKRFFYGPQILVAYSIRRGPGFQKIRPNGNQ